MADNIISARVLTREHIVERITRWVRRRADRLDDVEMRIQNAEKDLIAMGWRQGYVDGLGTIYINRWTRRRR